MRRRDGGIRCMEIWSHFLRDDYQCPGNMTICEEPLTNSITTPLRYSCWLENSLSAVKWRYVTNSFQQNGYAREVDHIERRTRLYVKATIWRVLTNSFQYVHVVERWPDRICCTQHLHSLRVHIDQQLTNETDHASLLLVQPRVEKKQLQIIQNRCFSYCYFILLAKSTIYDRLCYL